MLFVEIRFFVFLSFLLVVYWRVLKKNVTRKWLLLVASYVFYAAWDWRFLSLILISTITDYIIGVGLAQTENRRRALLLSSLVLNLGLLAAFKYFNFFTGSFIDFANLLGLPINRVTVEIVLPVGISFYTFQTLSYTIDVFRRKIEPTKKILDFALFVAFFPQLVAGPIVRAIEFLPQLKEPKKPSDVRIRMAVNLFLIGFAKKAVVSDSIARVVDEYFVNPYLFSGASAVIATLLYALQIYCDFSGYSDMAIASAEFFGYRLRKNFDFPYFSSNITDFWRRWHISLSTWLREYLYFSLGGNRRGELRTFRNLMLTMLLGGLWHGAGWNFIWWGALHGVALSVHKLWMKYFPRTTASGIFRKMISSVLTCYFVCVCWIFFRAENQEVALHVLRKFVWPSGSGEVVSSVWLLFLISLPVEWFLASHLVKEVAPEKSLPAPVYAMIVGVCIALLILFVPKDYQPFIYFQF